MRQSTNGHGFLNTEPKASAGLYVVENLKKINKIHIPELLISALSGAKETVLRTVKTATNSPKTWQWVLFPDVVRRALQESSHLILKSTISCKLHYCPCHTDDAWRVSVVQDHFPSKQLWTYLLYTHSLYIANIYRPLTVDQSPWVILLLFLTILFPFYGWRYYAFKGSFVSYLDHTVKQKVEPIFKLRHLAPRTPLPL